MILFTTQWITNSIVNNITGNKEYFHVTAKKIIIKYVTNLSAKLLSKLYLIFTVSYAIPYMISNNTTMNKYIQILP